MKKSSLQSIITAAFSIVFIEPSHGKNEMEKCQIIGFDKSGHEIGLIKEGMADCKSETSTCAGVNKAGEKEAWLYLPKGICEKIQGGTIVK